MKRKTDKQTEKTNLLDLFIICNVPSSKKFQLFCRFLTGEDVHEHEYFEESQVDHVVFPALPQLDEGYFDKTHFEYRCTENISLVEGFLFGIYDSYEDAVFAAQAYTAESLLDKYFAVVEEAQTKFADDRPGKVVGLE